MSCVSEIGGEENVREKPHQVLRCEGRVNKLKDKVLDLTRIIKERKENFIPLRGSFNEFLKDREGFLVHVTRELYVRSREVGAGKDLSCSGTC